MGDSMDSDLLPELAGETWVAATHLHEVTGDLHPSNSEPDLITTSCMDKTSPGGICSSASSRLPLNIDWGPCTQMLMASPVRVASVYDRIVR